MTHFETDILAKPEAIAALVKRASEFLRDAGIDNRAAHHVALVLDEILTNLITHGESPDSPAAIWLAIEDDRVKGEIIDSGPIFDPTGVAEPELHTDTADRLVGGLGLLLVRRLTSELGYARRDGRNHTTFSVARSPH